MKPKRSYKPGTVDDCQTPGYAIEPILKWLRFRNIEIIWECAESEGYLTDALRSKGFTVIATGLPDNDYLTCDPPVFDCIVTNPPFTEKHLFVKRCVELEMPWFLLMPMEAIATARVLNPLPKVNDLLDCGLIIPTKRINFKMPNKGWNGNGSQFPTAWYTNAFQGIRVFNADHWIKEYRQTFEEM